MKIYNQFAGDVRGLEQVFTCTPYIPVFYRLEIGKQADLLVWNAPSLNYIFYRYGNNLVDTVIKKGKIVKSK